VAQITNWVERLKWRNFVPVICLPGTASLDVWPAFDSTKV
jgi:hypothetical protein